MNIPPNILKALTDNDSFLAHAHLGPDADSIGSTLALKLGLESLGKVVNIYCEDSIPEFASFLPKVNQFIQQTLSDSLKTFEADIYISLDSAKWGLITHHTPVPELHIPLLNIDHHSDNHLETSLAWINTNSSSTAEMVFYLLDELEVDITPEISTCLLFGILGDTGAFQNLNTDSNSLRLAAILKEKGGDYARCLVELTRSTEYQELKGWGLLLDNLRISDDRSYVYSTMSPEDISKLEKSPQIGLFANAILGKVNGTKFGAVLAEKQPGITKGAIRARYRDVDVAQIARLMAGGGHPGAAGFRIEKPLKEAEQDFLNAVEYLQKQNLLDNSVHREKSPNSSEKHKPRRRTVRR